MSVPFRLKTRLQNTTKHFLTFSYFEDVIEIKLILQVLHTGLDLNHSNLCKYQQPVTKIILSIQLWTSYKKTKQQQSGLFQCPICL